MPLQIIINKNEIKYYPLFFLFYKENVCLNKNFDFQIISINKYN